MSTKQLARTVADGRMVSFTTSTGDVVEGFLCGMDDFHWMVITPTLNQVLVHKSAPKIEIGPASYLDPEHDTNRTAMEGIIRPFRAALQESGLVPSRSLSAVSAT